MNTQTIHKKKNANLSTVLKEIQEIRNHLDKFFLLIPEENVTEYKNSAHIKKAYREALRADHSK